MTLKEKFLPKMYCFMGSGMLSNSYDENVANSNADECEKIVDEFAIEFGRWIIQNQEIENTSSWSEDTANFYLKKFKKEKGL
jgi:hypothetical protein